MPRGRPTGVRYFLDQITGNVVALGSGMMRAGRVICRLTAAVRAPSIPLTAGLARSARQAAHVRCACGSSEGAACGAGGVMAWGRRRRRESKEGVDADYPLCLRLQRGCGVSPRSSSGFSESL